MNPTEAARQHFNPGAMPPLVQRVRRTDLGGMLGNRLDVPPGRQAVVAPPGRPPRTLGAGRHTLPGVRPWGAPPPITLAPEGEINLPCGAARLAAGDGQFVDAAFTAVLRVADPARLLAGRETVTELDAARLVTAHAGPALEPLVRRYAAADLCGPTPVAERLMADLRSRLTGDLAPLGLALVGLRKPEFRPARATAAGVHAIQQLQAALADPAATPETIEPLARQVEEVVAGEPLPRAPQPLQRALDAQLAGLVGQSLGRLETSPYPAAEEAPPEPPASERWQRLSLIFRIASAILFVATLTTHLLTAGPGDATQSVRWIGDSLGALGTLLLITLFIHTEHRARHARRAEVMPPSHLERIAARDRRHADRAVRDHLARELDEVERTLRATRARVYAPAGAGEQQALAIQRALEGVRRAGDEVRSAERGVPPYLADGDLPLRDLVAMLDYDRDLMIEANALSDAAAALQQAALAGDDVSEPTQAIAGQVAALQHRFAARARFHQESA
jgi:hypothetical protein